MDVELVVCSTSGKPIFHYHKSVTALSFQALDEHTIDSVSNTNVGYDFDANRSSHSFVSSLQGLLSFVKCMHHEDLQDIETEGCRCIFRTEDEILSYAAIVRESHGLMGCPITRHCLLRLLQLLHAQILFTLSSRGLDVLRRQPGYDLRELLTGTDRVVLGLSDRWARDPTYRLRGLGVRFIRIAPDLRLEITKTLAYEVPPESTESTSMICGLLFANGRVVAVTQPMKKHFSILVEDLLLLINFIYETPSFANAETWTPLCFPHFNDKGFLHAYVAFLSTEIALVLLSTQQSPEQFHHFQYKRTLIERRLNDTGSMDRLIAAILEQNVWRPHRDLPLLHHFVYKNELTGECATPVLEFPFHDNDTAILLLNQYAELDHLMFPSSNDLNSQILGKPLGTFQESVAARIVVQRTSNALYVALCSDEYRLYAWFDSLSETTDAQEQCHFLLDRLRRDDELIATPMLTSSLSLWP